VTSEIKSQKKSFLFPPSKLFLSGVCHSGEKVTNIDRENNGSSKDVYSPTPGPMTVSSYMAEAVKISQGIKAVNQLTL
jgi:hypothetical protein